MLVGVFRSRDAFAAGALDLPDKNTPKSTLPPLLQQHKEEYLTGVSDKLVVVSLSPAETARRRRRYRYRHQNRYRYGIGIARYRAWLAPHGFLPGTTSCGCSCYLDVGWAIGA